MLSVGAVAVVVVIVVPVVLVVVVVCRELVCACVRVSEGVALERAVWA